MRLFISWKVPIFGNISQIYLVTFSVQVSDSERQKRGKLPNFSHAIYFCLPAQGKQGATSKASTCKMLSSRVEHLR